MTMTLNKMKKSMATNILFAMILSLFALFVTSNVSFATDPPAPNKGGAVGNVNASATIDKKSGDMTMTLTGGEFGQSSPGESWTTFIQKYRNFIVGISGVGAVSMILFFIFQFMKLGANATNPSARSQILVGLVWSGVASAGLGAVAILVGFFYNAIG